MDSETVFKQFSDLETRIERLIKTCKHLEAANAELEQKNQQLAVQIQEKIAFVKQHDELKAMIRTKIDSLMGRLDEFTEE